MENKKSFSLFELILVLLILSIIYFQISPKKIDNNLELATKKLTYYINYTKNLSLNNNTFDIDEKYWYKKRWTFKIQNCSSSIGGIYFLIFKDSNTKGYVNKEETLKDPLTNKWLYSNYDCVNSKDESDDVLLTKKYNIQSAELSCNKSSTIAQIIFGEDGRIYTKYSNKVNNSYEYEEKEDCFLKITDDKGKSSIIRIP